jgi:putative transferase (TIGR04331 family)
VSIEEKVLQEEREDIRLLLKYLPEYLVEYFDFYLRQAKKYPEHPISIHYFRLFSIFNKFLVASWVNEGSKVNIYQHGSGYGEFYKKDISETKISDVFYTWGWSLNNKHTPGPAYPLEKFRKQYLNSKRKAENRKDILLCPPNMESIFREYVIDSIETLRRNLDKEKYKSILIRPRPKGNGLSFRNEFLMFKDNGFIEVDSGLGRNRIAELIKNAHLVIHLQSPSTTLLECIYVDHPIMSIIRPFRFTPTEIAVECYNNLIKIGVLHETPEALVNKLNSINSINEWWTNVIASPEYNLFKNTFCKHTQI